MNQRGFTWIEVMVAVAILGVALIPMMGMFSAGLNSYAGAGEQSVALNLAQGKIEELRAEGYDALADQQGTLPQGLAYRVQVSNMALTGLKQVTVEVDYGDVYQNTRTIQLVTMVAEH